MRNVLVRNRYTPVRAEVMAQSNLRDAVSGHNVQLNELFSGTVLRFTRKVRATKMLPTNWALTREP